MNEKNAVRLPLCRCKAAAGKQAQTASLQIDFGFLSNPVWNIEVRRTR
ncbi:MAG TPA: hypothetical protein PLD83_06795 [Oscillospiraceae bacterium]|nr:hypothetical protein [Oscillospiraceae bacterium]